jgi:predicted PurR-regulated permease PerM
VFLFVWGITILSATDSIVRFLLAKKMADVHPVVTVLGVIIGIQYFGITGLVFGPLIISYFIILLRIYYIEYQNPSPFKKRTKDTNPTFFTLPFLGKTKTRKPLE